MPARGIIRDILMLYFGYRLIKLWYLNEEFTVFLGILTIVLVGFSVWFLLERAGAL